MIQRRDKARYAAVMADLEAHQPTSIWEITQRLGLDINRVRWYTHILHDDREIFISDYIPLRNGGHRAMYSIGNRDDIPAPPKKNKPRSESKPPSGLIVPPAISRWFGFGPTIINSSAITKKHMIGV